MQNNVQTKKVDSKSVLKGASGQRKGKTIKIPITKARNKAKKKLVASSSMAPLEYIKEESLIEAEVREVFRIKAGDFRAFKNSFEEWSEQWQ